MLYELYLVVMLLVGDPDTKALVQIDPASYETAGYILSECNTLTPFEGFVDSKGNVEGIDSEGKIYYFSH